MVTHLPASPFALAQFGAPWIFKRFLTVPKIRFQVGSGALVMPHREIDAFGRQFAPGETAAFSRCNADQVLSAAAAPASG